MTPIDLDAIAKQVREATGAAHVEIVVTMEDGSSVTHEDGEHPDSKLSVDFGDWVGSLSKAREARKLYQAVRQQKEADNMLSRPMSRNGDTDQE